jgi:DNA-binding NtrC family response regulator
MPDFAQLFGTTYKSFKKRWQSFDTFSGVMDLRIVQDATMMYKPVLLVLHNDNQLLRQIAKMTSELCELVVARNATHAGQVLKNADHLNALIVGKPADGASALDVLRTSRSQRPQVRTILLGDPTDLSVSIEALHSGIVDHVLSPPLREKELVAILKLPAPRAISPVATVSTAVPRHV